MEVEQQLARAQYSWMEGRWELGVAAVGRRHLANQLNTLAEGWRARYDRTVALRRFIKTWQVQLRQAEQHLSPDESEVIVRVARWLELKKGWSVWAREARRRAYVRARLRGAWGRLNEIRCFMSIRLGIPNWRVSAHSWAALRRWREAAEVAGEQRRRVGGALNHLMEGCKARAWHKWRATANEMQQAEDALLRGLPGMTRPAVGLTLRRWHAVTGEQRVRLVGH